MSELWYKFKNVWSFDEDDLILESPDCKGWIIRKESGEPIFFFRDEKAFEHFMGFMQKIFMMSLEARDALSNIELMYEDKNES